MIGPGSHLRPWVRAAVLVAAPLVLLALFAASTYTPLFGLRTVRVEGISALSRDAVLQRSGLGSSTNVFHLDTGRIDAALATDPWVAHADVERDLPGTVVIRITERIPVAQTAEGETPVAVATDGVLLPGASPGGLPEIRAALGDLSDADRTAAAQALAAMTPVLRARVAAVVVGVGNDLRVDLAGGLSVEYGQGGQADAKAAALGSVLRWAVRERVALQAVDVSVPGAPSAILADGSSFPG